MKFWPVLVYIRIMIDDKYILEKFWKKKICLFRRKMNENSVTQEELDYLDNRFSDSTCREETIYRIKYGVNKRPVCKTCGKPLVFGRWFGFPKFCSNNCSGADLEGTKARAKGLRNKYDPTTKEGLENRKIKKSKTQSTCLEKYGEISWFKTKDCKQRIVDKYGVDNWRKTDDAKNRTSELMTGNKDIQTKREESMLKRYGNKNPWHTDKFYKEHNLSEIAYKGHLTKLKNGSYKQSKQENETYEKLITKYKKVKRQYKEDRYPFNCDFYIPELDLFIECQYFYTHNDHPFDKNNLNDIELAKQIKEKGHENAWHTWTIRDVNKRETAKKNSLNYLEFFTLDEFNKWFEEQ